MAQKNLKMCLLDFISDYNVKHSTSRYSPSDRQIHNRNSGKRVRSENDDEIQENEFNYSGLLIYMLSF